MAIKYQGHDKAAKEDKEEKYCQGGRSPCRDHDHQQRKKKSKSLPPIHTTVTIKKRGPHYHGEGKPSNSFANEEKVHSRGIEESIVIIKMTIAMILKSASTSRRKLRTSFAKDI